MIHQASSLAIDKLLVRNRHEFTEWNLTPLSPVAVSFRAAGPESQEGGGDEEPSGWRLPRRRRRVFCRRT